MSIIQAARLSRAPLMALTGIGMFWGAFAAYVPDIKVRAGASDSALGLAIMMSAVGGIIAMALAPVLMARLGRFTLPLTAVVLAALLLGEALAPLQWLGGALLIGSIWVLGQRGTAVHR